MKYNGDDNKSGFWEQEKSRLEDKLVNKIFKCLIRFLIEVIVMTVLIVGINIFMNGMYLWGLPRINDIQSVNITYPSVTDRDFGAAHSGGGFRRGQRDGADCKGHAGTACCLAAAVRNRHPDPGCAVCRGCNF